MRGSIPFLVSLCLSVPVFADHAPFTKDGLTYPMRSSKTPTTTDLADFEDLAPGPLETKNGTGPRFANTHVVADGIGGSVSLRHVSDGSGLAGFQMAGPVFARGFHRFSQDIRIVGGSTYQLCPIDTTLKHLITRISFEPDGSVLVGEINHQQDRFEFHDTSVDVRSGQILEVTIETTPRGLFHVWLDNEKVYTGIETNYAGSGQVAQTNGMLYYARNEMEGASLTVDNLLPAPHYVNRLSVKGEQLTIEGNCPRGVDIFARGPQGTVQVATGVPVFGSADLLVPFYPDSIYFASEDGGRSAMNGITSGLTVPTLGQWGIFSFALAMMIGSIFFMRRRRLA